MVACITHTMNGVKIVTHILMVKYFRCTDMTSVTCADFKIDFRCK